MDYNTNIRPYQSDNEHALKFEVDAGLLFQLGEQLVARRSIALAELIKNAYDADATKVTVTFRNVTKMAGSITVEDNGNGMTLDDIHRGWMRVAGSQKVEQQYSPRLNRAMTGAKGIGRFATRRLARRLTICSVGEYPDKTREQVIVSFNWDKFLTGVDLTTVPVRYRRRTVSPQTPCGVTLRLKQVRDEWKLSDAEEVRRDLLSLVTPTVSSQEEGLDEKSFSVELNSDEFPNIGGTISDFFLQSAWAKLTGYVDEQGRPHYQLHRRGSEEEETFSPTDGSSYSTIPLVNMTVYYVVYKSEYIVGLGHREATSYGREQGGIRVFLDNFRVFPYGDAGDDWLNLDTIKAGRLTTVPDYAPSLLQRTAGRPLLNIPGNYQVFGAVNISRIHQPGLQLTMSRERLIENVAFEELVRFVQIGIFWLSVVYTRSLAEQDKKPKQIETISSTLQQLEKLVEQSQDISQPTKHEIQRLTSSARQTAESREAELISELSLLRVLASAGTTILVFTHQLRAIVDGLARINANFRDLRDEIPSNLHPEFNTLLDQLQKWRTTVESQAIQLGILLSVDSRTHRRRLVVYEVVESVINPLKGYTDELGISVKNHVPRTLRTPPMFEAELHSILLNLFTNALKALRGQSQREIVIEGVNSERGVTIRMSDTGIGLVRAKWKEVFLPLVSTSEPDPILGVGTGIGLTVVHGLVESYGGIVHFVEPVASFKTTVEFFLPREV